MRRSLTVTRLWRRSGNNSTGCAKIWPKTRTTSGGSKSVSCFGALNLSPADQQTVYANLDNSLIAGLDAVAKLPRLAAEVEATSAKEGVQLTSVPRIRPASESPLAYQEQRREPRVEVDPLQMGGLLGHDGIAGSGRIQTTLFRQACNL